MRAIVCPAFGPPEGLVLEDVPDPVAGPGEVLVDVDVATVTFPDTLMLEDKYQFKVAPPYTPGGEVAGRVLVAGEGTAGWSPGDLVIGTCRGGSGGFAERAAVPVAGARRVPEGVDPALLTGLNYAYGTSLYGLRDRGQLQPGETLLVLGAAGAVGLSAVELGRVLGARVIAAASTPEKLALCRDRGADETIDYATEDLKERAKELTGGQGVDVVYDCVGGSRAEPALRAMAWEGRYLVIGFAAGIPSVPLNLALLKGCQIVGVFYGSMASRTPERARAITDELYDLVAAGDLRPHVSERYPLARAPEALRSLMDRQAVGKVVVVP